MSPPPTEVTRLLQKWSSGDKEALDRLMPLVCDELRDLAQRYLRRELEGHTLQPTALVNELYLRLHGRRRVDWKNRAHFFGFAARTMRHILVDHARGRLSAKRGEGAAPISLEVSGDFGVSGDEDLIALDDALKALAELDPRQCQLVELRFFVGLSIDETAEVLGISTATVKREWKVAKLWLRRELSS